MEQLPPIAAEYDQILQALAENTGSKHAATRQMLADRARYQLAQIHDLMGNQNDAVEQLGRISTSAPAELRYEAAFRAAEAAFADSQYQDALTGYTVAAEAASPYRSHALYMLGWSHIRLGEYAAALPALNTVVASLSAQLEAGPTVPGTTGIIAPEGSGKNGLLTGISKTPAPELMIDSLRAIVLALDLTGGVTRLSAGGLAVAQPVDAAGQQRLRVLVYGALSAWYAGHKRLQDSIDVCDAFERDAPMDRHAPLFALRGDALTRRLLSGGEDVSVASTIDATPVLSLRQRREQFVERYGLTSPFVAHVGQPVLQTYAPALERNLRQIIKRRASYRMAARPLTICWCRQFRTTGNG